jgi:hypothetical protein
VFELQSHSLLLLIKLLNLLRVFLPQMGLFFE